MKFICIYGFVHGAVVVVVMCSSEYDFDFYYFVFGLGATCVTNKKNSKVSLSQLVSTLINAVIIIIIVSDIIGSALQYGWLAI